MVHDINSSAKDLPQVLIFTDWYLPGYKAGGPVTSIHNIVEQLNHMFEFHIITTHTDYLDEIPYSDVSYDKWNKRSENEFVYYHSGKGGFKQIRKVAMATRITTWYITGIYSLNFAIRPLLIARKNKRIRAIVAPRGMLSAHALGVKSMKKEVFLRIARAVNLFKNVVFQATNEQEKNDVRKLFPSLKVVVAPNLPKPIQKDKLKKIEKVPGLLKLVSVGRIAPEKNTLFALEVLKKFADNHPTQGADVEMLLYGQIYDQEYWRKCQVVIDELSPYMKIGYRGSVSPERLGEIYQASHFLFLPTRGENFGHAIVESFASGRPVLISDQTPWKKLEEKNIGFDVSLNEDKEFVKALTECLKMDQKHYENMSKAAIDFAEKVVSDPGALEAHIKLFSP